MEVYYDLTCGHKKAKVVSTTRVQNHIMVYKMTCLTCGYLQVRIYDIHKKKEP